MEKVLAMAYQYVDQSESHNSLADTVLELETYKCHGLPLTSATQLVTIDMMQWKIYFDHQQILVCLKEFLREYIPVHIQQTLELSIETIVTLIELLLRLQYSVHDFKLYRQTHGYSTDSLLFQQLINISIYCWQQKLMKLLPNNKELCYR